MTEPSVVNVLPLSELEPNSAKRVDIDGHRLAVIRFEGDDVHIIGDRCSHADFSLGEGELDSDDRTLECWKHGSTFSVETGAPTCLPATKAVPVYDARVVDGTIQVIITEASDNPQADNAKAGH